MPIKSQWHALTKASTVINPILKYITGLGITPMYVPSLGFTDAIDHKRIRFNSAHLPQDKLSNFPIFAWSRTPVVVSDEMTNMRRILVQGIEALNTGVPYPLNYAAGTFTLNWAILFNNISDLEEFEVVYTSEKLFSDFREFRVYIPPLCAFSRLKEEDRGIYVGTEWQMFTNVDTNKLNDYVQFSLTGSARLTFPVLSITEIDLPLLKELELSFYSDLEMAEKRESFLFQKGYNDEGKLVEGTILQTDQIEQMLYHRLKED